MGMKHAMSLALLALGAAPAAAQLAGGVPKSKATGLLVSASAQIARIQFENARFAQSGAGGSATIAYGFNSRLAAVLTGSSVVMHWDDAGNRGFVLDQIVAGIRFHMTDANWRWVPFIDLAIGPTRLFDGDFEMCSFASCERGELRRSGIVFAQSVGLAFFPVRRLSIVASAHVNQASMTKQSFQGIETLTTTTGGAQELRLSLGGTLALGGGRP